MTHDVSSKASEIIEAKIHYRSEPTHSSVLLSIRSTRKRSSFKHKKVFASNAWNLHRHREIDFDVILPSGASHAFTFKNTSKQSMLRDVYSKVMVTLSTNLTRRKQETSFEVLCNKAWSIEKLEFSGRITRRYFRSSSKIKIKGKRLINKVCYLDEERLCFLTIFKFIGLPLFSGASATLFLDFLTKLNYFCLSNCPNFSISVVSSSHFHTHRPNPFNLSPRTLHSTCLSIL